LNKLQFAAIDLNESRLLRKADFILVLFTDFRGCFRLLKPTDGPNAKLSDCVRRKSTLIKLKLC
jgi:hypothetical protein